MTIDVKDNLSYSYGRYRTKIRLGQYIEAAALTVIVNK